MPEPSTFGPRLADLRRTAGLSQRQLADRLGMPQSSIARLESGRHKPSLALVDRLAGALGVDLNAFAGCYEGEGNE